MKFPVLPMYSGLGILESFRLMMRVSCQNLYDAEVLGVDLGVVGILPLGRDQEVKILDLCFVPPLENQRLRPNASLCSDLSRWDHLTVIE